MTRNSFWTVGCIGDEAHGGLGKEGTLYTGDHSASGCFGLKSSRNHKLGATPLLHRPADRLGEDSPTSPWAVCLLHSGNYDFYTRWWYNCFFHLFFFPFSFKETECFWAVPVWHNYQCNCSFQSRCQPNYWERYIRKGNVIYSWVIFYNLLLRRCDFEWTGQACISKAYLLPPQAPTLIRLMAA